MHLVQTTDQKHPFGQVSKGSSPLQLRLFLWLSFLNFNKQFRITLIGSWEDVWSVRFIECLLYDHLRGCTQMYGAYVNSLALHTPTRMIGTSTKDPLLLFSNNIIVDNCNNTTLRFICRKSRYIYIKEPSSSCN